MIGFGFSVFTQAILGLGGGFRGSALNLDFTSGNRTLDPRITFSRTTNATLTNSAGLVANAPMNLLTYSEQFDNAAWTKTRATVTANALTAPDGAASADKLISSAGLDSHFLTRSVTSAVMTLSVFAKQGEFTHLKLSTNALSFQASYFNLSTGEVAQQGANHVAVIADAGDGWYRCSITPTNAFTNIYIENSGNSAAATHTGDGTSGIFIWGAQLELGSTATTYNPTTVKNLLGYTEHFDNAAWTKSNAFVQTNLLTYSQDFDNAAWTKGAGSVSANTAVAPDATSTGDLYVPDTTNARHRVNQTSSSVINGATYTMSVYAKASGYSKIALREDGVSGAAASFDLTTGTVLVGGSSASITPVGNDWYRCTFSSTSAATVFGFGIQVLKPDYVSGNNIVEAWTGNGTSGIYVWGAQVVRGTSAGDYKATYAATDAVGYSDIYGQPFAQKLVASPATSTHYTSGDGNVVSGAKYTASAYVKAAEYSTAIIGFLASTGFSTTTSVLVNLTEGTVSAGTGTPLFSAITNVGNGWYRVSVVLAASASGAGSIYVAAVNGTTYADRTVAGDGTSGIYIFGAQLSDSASVDPYVYNPVAAPSSVAYYGPRFDYDPVTLAPKGLLIEEQRTNLVTYSADFTNLNWVKTNTSVPGTAVKSPDNTTTGYKVIASAAGGTSVQHSVKVGSTYSVPANTTGTFSCYAKAAEYSTIEFAATGASAFKVTFTLTGNGSVSGLSGGTATITNVGNGWYRCTYTATTTAYDFVPYIYVNSYSSFVGDDISGVYLWGAQLEAGAFATSYIPTVASQVTRAADSASMIGNNFARWYNATQGTLFAQFDTPASGNRPVLSVGDGTANNMIQLRTEATDPYFRVTTGGVAQAGLDVGTVAANTTYKMTGAYEANNFSACINAGVVGSDTSGTVSVVTRMLLGSDQAGSYLNGHISRAAAYGRVLAATEQQGVTA